MEANYNQLSLEQRYAFEKFRQGENIFITGPGGTGKSKLIQFMKEWASMHHLNLTVCAMTGCAAVILNCGARTIHSWSGIRLAKGDISKIIASVLRNRNACKTWRNTSILILDEVSMLSARIFELLNTLGKKIRKNERPFGGIQLVFTGDFYQLPPVGGDADPNDSKFCFQSPEWPRVFPPSNWIELTTMFRQTDPKYIEILQQIRVGQLSDENAEYLTQYIKRPYNPADYGGLIPTKLYALRNVVEGVNQRMFRELQTEEYEYEMIVKSDCLQYMDGSNTPISVEDLRQGAELNKNPSYLEMEINTLKTQTQTPENLSLKEGAVVMCTTNLALDLGICNGSQGIIVGFGIAPDKYGYAEVPIVQFTNGVKMKIPIQYRHSADYPTVAIGQIPLCLAWAMTIHKIQGATISMAQMDIGKTIFEYGQTYVALSRIKSLDGLYLSAFMPQKIRANPDVVAFYNTVPKTNDEAMKRYITNNKYRGLPYFVSVTSNIITPTVVVRRDTNTRTISENNNIPNPFQSYSLPGLSSTTRNVVVVKKNEEQTVSNTETLEPPLIKTPAYIPPNPEETNTNNMCCVCLVEPKTVMLIPCNHVCLCVNCSKTMEVMKKCPICRSTYNRTMKLFL